MRNRRTILGIILGLALFSAVPAEAADPPTKPPASALGLIRDMRLTVLARRALGRDRELARLRLGVEVRDGIATLWGEVPSMAAKQQAVAKLKAINGIHGVRSELSGGFRDREIVADLSVPARVPVRIEVESAKPDSDTGTLKKKSRDRAVMVGGDVPKINKPGEFPEVKTLPMPGAKVNRGVVLRPPGSVSREKKPSGQTQEKGQALSLQEAVAKVKASENRFRSIPIEVRGDVVVVGRSGAEDEDITALAQALRRVRGVSEVVMRSE